MFVSVQTLEHISSNIYELFELDGASKRDDWPFVVLFALGVLIFLVQHPWLVLTVLACIAGAVRFHSELSDLCQPLIVDVVDPIIREFTTTTVQGDAVIAEGDGSKFEIIHHGGGIISHAHDAAQGFAGDGHRRERRFSKEVSFDEHDRVYRPTPYAREESNESPMVVLAGRIGQEAAAKGAAISSKRASGVECLDDILSEDSEVDEEDFVVVRRRVVPKDTIALLESRHEVDKDFDAFCAVFDSPSNVTHHATAQRADREDGVFKKLAATFEEDLQAQTPDIIPTHRIVLGKRTPSPLSTRAAFEDQQQKPPAHAGAYPLGVGHPSRKIVESTALFQGQDGDTHSGPDFRTTFQKSPGRLSDREEARLIFESEQAYQQQRQQQHQQRQQFQHHGQHHQPRSGAAGSVAKSTRAFETPHAIGSQVRESQLQPAFRSNFSPQPGHLKWNPLFNQDQVQNAAPVVQPFETSFGAARPVIAQGGAESGFSFRALLEDDGPVQDGFTSAASGVASREFPSLVQTNATTTDSKFSYHSSQQTTHDNSHAHPLDGAHYPAGLFSSQHETALLGGPGTPTQHYQHSDSAVRRQPSPVVPQQRVVWPPPSPVQPKIAPEVPIRHDRIIQQQQQQQPADHYSMQNYYASQRKPLHQRATQFEPRNDASMLPDARWKQRQQQQHQVPLSTAAPGAEFSVRQTDNSGSIYAAQAQFYTTSLAPHETRVYRQTALVEPAGRTAISVAHGGFNRSPSPFTNSSLSAGVPVPADAATATPVGSLGLRGYSPIKFDRETPLQPASFPSPQWPDDSGTTTTASEMSDHPPYGDVRRTPVRGDFGRDAYGEGNGPTEIREIEYDGDLPSDPGQLVLTEQVNRLKNRFEHIAEWEQVALSGGMRR